MSLLTPKGKKGDQKKKTNLKNNTTPQSKFFANKPPKGGPAKKGMTGGSQRGS